MQIKENEQKLNWDNNRKKNFIESDRPTFAARWSRERCHVTVAVE